MGQACLGLRLQELTFHQHLTTSTSPNIIRAIKSRRTRLAGHITRIWVIRNAYNVLVLRPEGKRPRGRPEYRLEDNIKCVLGR